MSLILRSNNISLSISSVSYVTKSSCHEVRQFEKYKLFVDQQSATQFVEFSLHNNTDDFIELQNIRQIKLIRSIKNHTEEAKYLNSKLLKIQKNFIVVGNNMNLLCSNQRKLYQQWFKVTSTK
ncbi:Hypothetical_protein [Hexamita inflata]|uniref:Hypothetical_protein n=1 Tax=Hexamita inflata TaxID=28002 RepID=A0AA86Q2K0_9EUKA|nr:Hypothetical protein HINF_LOCUS35993 [Hexamita inflata]